MTAMHRDQKGHDEKQGMVPAAEKNLEFRTRSQPMAKPQPALLPRPAALSLVASVVVGAVLGVLFAAALLRGIIAIPGWEAMFADGTFTLYMLWAGVGAGFGIIVSAVIIAILPEDPPARP